MIEFSLAALLVLSVTALLMLSEINRLVDGLDQRISHDVLAAMAARRRSDIVPDEVREMPEGSPIL